MKYELWLAVRYLLARQRERFVSLIGLLSVGGIALGVMALLVVLAVMSGFDHDLKAKLIGTNAHVSVEAQEGLRVTDALLRAVAGAPGVVGVTPFIMGQAIVRLPDRAFGVLVRGLDPEHERRVTKLQDYLVMGHLPEHDHEVVIGTELAKEIGAGPGEALRVIGPADGKLHVFMISGLFRSGMYDYDAGLIGVTIPRAQELFGFVGTVTGLAVRLDRIERAEAVKADLAAHLGAAYVVKTWMELNPVLFGALRLEKIVMFIIVALVIAVAALNILSMLIMMVMDKTKDIGILRSIGATRSSIASLFLLQGCLVGAVGTGLGLAGGLALTANLNSLAKWLERTFGIAVFPPTIYYLDHIPTRIDTGDLTMVVGAAFLLALLAGVYPAVRAARLSPVEALRYE